MREVKTQISELRVKDEAGGRSLGAFKDEEGTDKESSTGFVFG
jgi:hypothetical protein